MKTDVIGQEDFGIDPDAIITRHNGRRFQSPPTSSNTTRSASPPPLSSHIETSSSFDDIVSLSDSQSDFDGGSVEVVENKESPVVNDGEQDGITAADEDEENEILGEEMDTDDEEWENGFWAMDLKEDEAIMLKLAEEAAVSKHHRALLEACPLRSPDLERSRYVLTLRSTYIVLTSSLYTIDRQRVLRPPTPITLQHSLVWSCRVPTNQDTSRLLVALPLSPHSLHPPLPPRQLSLDYQHAFQVACLFAPSRELHLQSHRHHQTLQARLQAYQLLRRPHLAYGSRYRPGSARHWTNQLSNRSSHRYLASRSSIIDLHRNRIARKRSEIGCIGQGSRRK